MATIKGNDAFTSFSDRHKAATLTEAIVCVTFRRAFSYLVIMAFDFCTARSEI